MWVSHLIPFAHFLDFLLKFPTHLQVFFFSFSFWLFLVMGQSQMPITKEKKTIEPLFSRSHKVVCFETWSSEMKCCCCIDQIIGIYPKVPTPRPDNLPIGVLRRYTQGLGVRRSQNKCLPKVEPRWTYLGEQWDPRPLPNVKHRHKKNHLKLFFLWYLLGGYPLKNHLNLFFLWYLLGIHKKIFKFIFLVILVGYP